MCTIAITVLNKTEIDALLKGKWEGMKGALMNKDVEAAMSYLTVSSRDMFRYNFELMKALLPTIASDMSNIELKRVENDLSEYDVFAVQDGIEYSFYVEFHRDFDGIWRISFF